MRRSRDDLAQALRGAAIRLHAGPPHDWIVAVANVAEAATPAVLKQPARLAGLLTHDRGVHQPDAFGQAVLRNMLAEGGTALLAFSNLADAMKCQAWLQGLAGGAA
jgi:hypothetical protein